MSLTLVLGASADPEKYSNKAVARLHATGEKVLPLGIKSGSISGIEILTGMPEIKGVDTVSLYVSPKHQSPYYQYILNVLKPRRIIFNPGTENPEFEKMADASGIEALQACTLTMLSVGNY